MSDCREQLQRAFSAYVVERELGRVSLVVRRFDRQSVERKLPLSDAVWRAARNSSALNLPDAVLARMLYTQLDRAMRPLIALLRDPNWRMRAMAADALNQIGDPAVADAM